MEGIENVQLELEGKRQEIQRELASLRETFKSLEGDLESVEEALAALTNTKPRASKGKSKRKEVPSAEELQRFFLEAHQADAYANAEDLKQAVRSKVKAADRSLSRFAQLYDEAVQTSTSHGHAGNAGGSQGAGDNASQGGSQGVFDT